MKPATFEYHAPTSVGEAASLLHELGDDAKVLAGGQSLVPLLALRLAAYEHLVDIGRIGELRELGSADGHAWVGAAVTEAAIEESTELGEAVPLLARVTPLIGHWQIRNRGTLGGSIAHADPAAEYPAVALAMDATMEVLSVRGRRSIAAADFFDGLWTTSLEADELLLGVRFPVWTGRCGYAIEELARRHGDFAIAGAVAAVQLGPDDQVERCAIGLIGLGSTPLRSTAAEAAVAGGPASAVEPAEVGRLAMAALEDVPADLQGSAAYRTRVGAEMVARAWASACSEASDG